MKKLLFVLMLFGIVILFFTGCSSKLFKTIVKGRINSVVLNKQYVWIGTYDDLIKYDKINDKYEEIKNFLVQPLKLEKLFFIADDNEWLWCGTGGHEAFGKIILYDKNKNTLKYFGKEVGLIGAPIWYILVDKSDVWFGGGNPNDEPINQLIRYDKKKNKWETHRIQGDIVIPQISERRYLWVGTSHGINRYDKSNNKWELIEKIEGKEFYMVKIINDNKMIWILDTGRFGCEPSNKIEIFKYNEDKDEWTSYQTSIESANNTHRSITSDEFYIWVVVCGDYGGGLYRFDKKSNQWKECIVIKGKIINPNTCIKMDQKYIWFGIGDLGLIQYNKNTQKWNRFTTNDGLSGDKVLNINIDDEYIWVGTSNGLSRTEKKD